MGRLTMKIARACLYLILLTVVLVFGAYIFALATSAQTTAQISAAQNAPQPQPDIRRTLGSREEVLDSRGRKGGYVPTQQRALQIRQAGTSDDRPAVPSQPSTNPRKTAEDRTLASIDPG